MRILGKKKGEKDNSKVGGEIGSGGRRIRPIHISHWWRPALTSTVIEDQTLVRTRKKSIRHIE